MRESSTSEWSGIPSKMANMRRTIFRDAEFSSFRDAKKEKEDVQAGA